MKQTTNLKLNKPDTGDPVKISDLNGNMDVLDKAIVIKDGKATIGQASIGENGYVTGTWLQTTGATNLGKAPTEYPVLSGGWIYKRTPEQMKADLGIGDIKPEVLEGKLDKSGGAMTGYLTDPYTGQVRNITQSDRIPIKTDGKDGDVWIAPGEEPVKIVINSVSPDGLVTTVNGVSSAPVKIPSGGKIHMYVENFTTYPTIGTLSGTSDKIHIIDTSKSLPSSISQNARIISAFATYTAKNSSGSRWNVALNVSSRGDSETGNDDDTLQITGLVPVGADYNSSYNIHLRVFYVLYDITV